MPGDAVQVVAAILQISHRAVVPGLALLYSIRFNRGFGTLYTAALWPQRRELVYSWPGAEWRLTLAGFREDTRLIEYTRAR